MRLHPYARSDTRGDLLAVAYTRAEENSVLVGALVDLEGGAGGTPRVYTVLEDEALCSNPEWASCPARMACIQCEFHVPRDLAWVVAARASVRQMLQKVALRSDKRAALERDEAERDDRACMASGCRGSCTGEPARITAWASR